MSECCICYNDFDLNSKVPKSLLCCGLTICLHCVCKIQEDIEIKCPSCRKVTCGANANSFPDNENFKIFLKEKLAKDKMKHQKVIKFNKQRICSKHEKQITHFFCEQCKEFICQKCLVKKHLNHQYNVVPQINELNNMNKKAKEHLKFLNVKKTQVVKQLKYIQEKEAVLENKIENYYDELISKLKQQKQQFIKLEKAKADAYYNKQKSYKQNISQKIKEMQYMSNNKRPPKIYKPIYFTNQKRQLKFNKNTKLFGKSADVVTCKEYFKQAKQTIETFQKVQMISQRAKGKKIQVFVKINIPFTQSGKPYPFVVNENIKEEEFLKLISKRTGIQVNMLTMKGVGQLTDQMTITVNCDRSNGQEKEIEIEKSKDEEEEKSKEPEEEKQ